MHQCLEGKHESKKCCVYSSEINTENKYVALPQYPNKSILAYQQSPAIKHYCYIIKHTPCCARKYFRLLHLSKICFANLISQIHIFAIKMNIKKLLVLPHLKLSIEFYIETSYLSCRENGMTGIFVKCNTELKSVNSCNI